MQHIVVAIASSGSEAVKERSDFAAQTRAPTANRTLSRQFPGHIGHHVRHLVQDVESRLRCDVRRQDDVPEPQQFVIAAAGLFVERVEREAAKPAGSQGLDKGVG